MVLEKISYTSLQAETKNIHINLKLTKTFNMWNDDIVKLRLLLLQMCARSVIKEE